MDDQERTQKLKPLLWIAILLAAVAAVVAIVVRPWRRLRRPEPVARPIPPLPAVGLTEAEAEGRRLEGQDNAIYVKPPRSRQQIWRENVYNLFNLNLVGLALVQLLLGKPLDALISIGTIGLNIGLNIFQEMFARRRLREAELAARPKATVIRDETARSVDPSEIVRDDLLVVGPGDQLLVDGEVVGEGQILVDESMLTGDTGRQVKRAGDQVLAGSYCVGGHAAYLAQRVGDERLIATRGVSAPDAKTELTPLERIVQRILRVLIVVVAVFTALLLSAYFRLDVGVPPEAFTDAASVVYNIAPSSLFFLIVLTYAAGTADLGKIGALVHRARSVESLAEATVLCFAKAGILTGSHVEVDAIEPPEGEQGLAESRLRQILGDYARSTSVDNLATRAMLESFEGSRRQVREEAPFLSVYGWSALAFDDDDLRGVYVLGDEEVLAAQLAALVAEGEEEEGGGPRLPDVRKAFAPLGRLFRRSSDDAEADEAGETAAEAARTETATARTAALRVEGPGQAAAESIPSQEVVPLGGETATEAASTGGQAGTETLLPDVEAAIEADRPRAGIFRRLTGPGRRLFRHEEATPEEGETPAGEDASLDGDEPSRNVFRRLTHGFRGLFRRGEEEPEEEDTLEAPPVEEAVLLFAYKPDVAPLHAPDGKPRLPYGLVPVSRLRLSERVRPEAVDTIETFTETGVGFKVFTPAAPDQTANLLRQAGLGRSEANPLNTISGSELEAMDEGQFAQAVAENLVFGHVSPDQAGQAVAALREGGEAVAVVGDGVTDLAAMRQAGLAIARQSSSQAALGAADIVLLGDSPAVLSRVLEKGQRIVNGLMDVLKLQLTQVLYLALLIVAVQLAAVGFPYQSAQGTAITLATVALPSIGLSLWAVAGRLPRASLGRLLSRFVIPAAVTICVAALVVYLYFLDTSDLAYAQLAVTWSLVSIGLVLSVLAKPPWPTRVRGAIRPGDWRPLLLALVVLALFVVVCAIPLLQELLKVAWLQKPEHYGLIALVTLVWALVVNVIWWIWPVERRR